MADESLKAAAMEYHRSPRPGKLAIVATKPPPTSASGPGLFPGVAAACEAIVADPVAAAEVTSRANLLAVVTNGTAVLGLGLDRTPGGQAGDGRQGVLFKIRRYRRLRSGDQ